jgi:hypothetical protein
MNTFSQNTDQFPPKFKLIFLPYLIIAISTIVLYTFLNWLLIIKFNLFKVDDSIVSIIMPLVLPWAPILIWLRPRIKMLRLKKGYRKDPVFWILFVNGLSIAIPLVIAQAYIITATGKLTRLDYIEEIQNTPKTQFYTAEHFYINKNMAHVKVVFTVSGKSNSDFDMAIYASVPVFNQIFPDTNKIADIRNNADAKALVIINDTLSNRTRLKRLTADSIRMMRYVNGSLVMPKYGDTGKYGAILIITRNFKFKVKPPVTKIEPVIWLAVKYTKTISNSLSRAEKDERYKNFAWKSNADFMHKHLDKFVYLAQLPYNKDLKIFTDAITSKDDVIGDDPIILSPVYTAFADRNGDKLAWIFAAFAIGSLIFILILFFTPLATGGNDEGLYLNLPPSIAHRYK